MFTALAVAHCIQESTGLAIGNVVKQLRLQRTATIVINDVTETFPPHPRSPAPSEKSSLTSASTNRGTKQNVLTRLFLIRSAWDCPINGGSDLGIG